MHNSPQQARSSKLTSASSSIASAAAKDAVSAVRDAVLGKGIHDPQDWYDCYKSQLQEFDYVIPACDIEGRLPKDLEGTLFRNGPSRFERGGVPYKHFLDGDGCVLRFTVKDGKAHLKTRFVRTAEYLQEEAADAVLYRSIFGTQPSVPLLRRFADSYWHPKNFLNLKLKNSANTSVICWGGQLLALFEAGLPYAMCADTLATRSECDMGMAQSSDRCHTAHLHYDPVRDVMVGWSKGLRSTTMTFREWDRQFKCVGERVYTPKALKPNPHDFAVTEDYYVFFENEGSFKVLPFLLGFIGAGETVMTSSVKPMQLHIVPRPVPAAAAAAAASSPASAAAGTAAGSATAAHSTHAGSSGSVSDGFVLDVAVGHSMHISHAFQDGDLLHVFSTAYSAADVRGYVEMVNHSKQQHNSGHSSSSSSSTASTLPAATDGVSLGDSTNSGEGVPAGHPKQERGGAPVFEGPNGIPMTYLLRTSVNLRTQQLLESTVVEGCEDMSIEHPHLHPDVYGTKKARFLYTTVANDIGLSTPPQGLCRFDMSVPNSAAPVGTQTAANGVQFWYPGTRCFVNEPLIVPRKKVDSSGSISNGFSTLFAPKRSSSSSSSSSSSAAATNDGSDDVYVITTVEDAAAQRSYVAVLNGRDIAAGPVCKIWLPYLPHQIHGYWTEETFDCSSGGSTATATAAAA